MSPTNLFFLANSQFDATFVHLSSFIDMMEKRKTPWLVSGGLIVAILLGWLLGRSPWDDASQHRTEIPVVKDEPLIERQWGAWTATTDRKQGYRADEEAMDQGALPGQRSVRFASAQDMQAFLERMGDRVRVLDRMDALHALRVSFLDPADLRELLDGSEELGMIFPAYTPNPSGGMVQADAVPLGNQLLQWLGLKDMDPSLGQGVKIAILDTGVVPHPAFGHVKNVFIVPGLENYEEWNGHGTAAASLILGNSATVPGAAPGATLTSWRVADDSGSSDSWKIAQAVIQAADAGNQIISISMGSYGDSVMLRDAVQYAQKKNVLIIASSGNDGFTQSAYPAGYPDVIAAVAVDAQNNHLLFSNQSSLSALSTPGWGVSAAYPGDLVASFSGTSASAPILAGTVAAVMSAKGLSPQQALAAIYQMTNETGPAGPDAYTGSGAVNLGRILQSDTSQIADAAAASNYITPPQQGSIAQVQVNIQNQGTTTLSNVPVTVTTPSGVTNLMVPSLAPGAVKSYQIGLSNSLFANGQSVKVTTQIGSPDAVPFNNVRTTTYSPPPTP